VRLSDAELRAIYDDSYAFSYDPLAARRIGRLVPLFELTGRETVADFACGNGVLLELISPLVRSYTGVDFSDSFIRIAEQRRIGRDIRNGAFVCGDIVAFCDSHVNAFDVAFALDFSEHVYDDQFIEIFSAIHSALKPGGRLYIHTPNAEYFQEHLRARFNQLEGHVGVRDARSHEQLLARCGFSDVRVRYISHYLKVAAALHWLGALPAIGRYCRARLFLTCYKGV
jgi:SAM-dependent methyltransferase